MKRQLETATEAPSELESQVGAESMPELLNANDAGPQAPIRGGVSVPECDATRTCTRGLPTLQSLWAERQLILHCGLAGCCAAILLALIIPKQDISTAKLMPPEVQSTSSFGRFGSIAGDLLGVSSSGALLVAMMRSQTLEDRIIDRFGLKQVLSGWTVTRGAHAAGSKNQLQAGTEKRHRDVKRHRQ